MAPASGGVDLHSHIHIAQDTVESVELKQDAFRCGMSAIVLKDQLCPTVHKAMLTEKTVPGIKVYGGLVLNHTNSGLSPRTAAFTLRSGGKIVWLPTVDAWYGREKGRHGHWTRQVNERTASDWPSDDIVITDSTGKIRPEAREILSCRHEGTTPKDLQARPFLVRVRAD